MVSSTIVNHAALPAGGYQVRWDGRTDGGTAAGAGVYLLRLTAGAEVATRRFAIIH